MSVVLPFEYDLTFTKCKQLFSIEWFLDQGSRNYNTKILQTKINMILVKSMTKNMKMLGIINNYKCYVIYCYNGK